MTRKAETEFEEKPVRLSLHEVTLLGDLGVPQRAGGIVLFAHGSGSSHLSFRNRYIARYLQGAGMATLLFDLLTEKEEEYDRRTASLRFDISFLAARLMGATAWVETRKEIRDLPVGYFGASTGAAAALIAATQKPAVIRAVVSRGGRPDLAGPVLRDVKAPTLFIVGEKDAEVLTLNRESLEQVGGPRKLEIVPGATHLFEEAGALEAAAKLAAQWFHQYLPA
jgi:putative phosphoribosyl transferase